MATNLDIATALSTANTTHISMGQEIFTGKLPGPWQLWTDQINDSSGLVQNNVLANDPIMREWVGPRQVKGLRAYTFAIEAKSYEATLSITRQELTRDKTGAVSKKIGDFNRNGAAEYDRRTAEVLDGSSGAGPTGYDGVALYSAAHPHVNSSSGHSNLSAVDWSHANFNTARTAMRNFKNEQGEPMDIEPTHVRCGPDTEQRVKEVLEAKDRISFTDMVAAQTTTAVQNATLMPNVWQGECAVVVDPRVAKTNAYYVDIFDLSKPVKPMLLLVERAIEAIPRTDMDDPNRFDNDEFLFGLEGDHVATAGFWQTAYRLQGTA